MENKQKQIEELGCMIRYALEYGDFSHLNIHDRNRFLTGRNYIATAEKLYNAGYRKIPENAVVLTREGYKRLQRRQEFCKTCEEIATEMVKKARKETAEKFAERLKEKLNEWLEDNEDLDGKINFGIAQIELIGVKSLDGEIIAESLIEEICKEITDKEVQNGN